MHWSSAYLIQQTKTKGSSNMFTTRFCRTNILMMTLSTAMCTAVSTTAFAQQCSQNMTRTQQANDFSQTSYAETTTHKKTRLEWQRCSLGQTFVNGMCTGEAKRLGFNDAQSMARNDNSSGGGWRMPTQSELVSLIESACTNPAVNTEIFPATLAGAYWTSTAYAGNVVDAWSVSFSDGSVTYGNKITANYVRLVRNSSGSTSSQRTKQ